MSPEFICNLVGLGGIILARATMSTSSLNTANQKLRVNNYKLAWEPVDTLTNN